MTRDRTPQHARRTPPTFFFWASIAFLFFACGAFVFGAASVGVALLVFHWLSGAVVLAQRRLAASRREAPTKTQDTAPS